MTGTKLEYPKRLRFTSQYRCYKIFLVSPSSMQVEGQLIRKEGKYLEFKDWECICNDPETIKLALESGYYGKDYISPEWEKMKAEANKKELKTEEKEDEEISAPVSAKKGRPKKSV